MRIKNWSKHPDLEVYVRSALSYPGPVITWLGSRSGYPYYVNRRYAVIDARGTEIIKLVVAAEYVTSFDSSNPFEVHEKYITGEARPLLGTVHNGDIESALLWTGIIQQGGFA